MYRFDVMQDFAQKIYVIWVIKNWLTVMYNLCNKHSAAGNIVATNVHEILP